VKRRRSQNNVARSGEARGEAICGRFYRARSEFSSSNERSYDIIIIVVVVPFDDGVQEWVEEDGL